MEPPPATLTRKAVKQEVEIQAGAAIVLISKLQLHTEHQTNLWAVFFHVAIYTSVNWAAVMPISKSVKWITKLETDIAVWWLKQEAL